jgi:hypothetical protein
MEAKEGLYEIFKLPAKFLYILRKKVSMPQGVVRKFV